MKKRLSFILLFYSFLISYGQNNWTQKADYPGGQREFAFGLSIDNKLYVGFGCDSLRNPVKDFWLYDSGGDIWIQKTSINGAGRFGITGFSIGKKGYILTGYDNSSVLNEVWEYDSEKDNWRKLGNFPGEARWIAVGFSIGGKGFIGTGHDMKGKCMSDFWEYNPILDTWSQKDSLPMKRAAAVGFSIGGNGYVGSGWDTINGGNIYYKDFWEYDTISNLWTKKADLNASPRWGAVSFVIGGKAYYGLGSDGTYTKKDFWEYDNKLDVWTEMSSYPVISVAAFGVSVNGIGYVGTGFGGGTFKKGFYAYTPFMNGVPKINTQNEINIFPIPNNGKFVIESTMHFKNIEIYDLFGSVIYSNRFPDNITHTEITIGVKPGIYIIKITENSNVYIRKIKIE